MKDSFRQSMGWLHTWAGLIVSWVLFFMFVTGTLGYFDSELDRWMQPERPVIATVPLREQLNLAERFLQTRAADAQQWHIDLPTSRETPHLQVSWTTAEAATHGPVILDVVTGQPITVRDTGGGQTLYRMHYALHYLPREWTYRIVGICSLLMLLGLITGVLIHRTLFRDFFTFRSGKKIRSWLDMHNLLSVATLPFQLMITYSGLLFFFMLYLPLVIAGSYGFADNAEQQLRAQLFPRVSVRPSGVAADVVALHQVLEHAEQHWGVAKVAALTVHWPGDANGQIELERVPDQINRRTPALRVSAVDGEPLTSPAPDLPAYGIMRVLWGLHEGLFAGPLLRTLYFLSGLAGAGMIATGLLLWSLKRQKRHAARPTVAYRLVEGLNIGTLAGLPVALAGYFIANRLLPVTLIHRAEWEVHCFFLCWAACFCYPLVRGLARAYAELFLIGALAFVLLPLISASSGAPHLLDHITHGQWALVGVEVAMLLTGLLLAVAAWRLWPATALTVSALRLSEVRS